ncbi:MAG: class I SAM-dependent methyltransferase [Dermatophilaceae bacterium]
MARTPPLDQATEFLRRHYVSEYAEADRLTATIRGRLEFQRVRELVLRYLPAAPAVIADVGAGPGAHAEWMQAHGYQVELVDPIVEHVAQARQAGLSAQVGDARLLPWPDDRFDLALLAGPLYHLVTARDRAQALGEAIRVTKPGGYVAAIGLNRHANLIGATIAGQLLEREHIVAEIEQSGWSESNDRWPAPTYYHAADELRDELTGAGLDAVTLHGVSGPGGWLAVAVDRYGLPDNDHTYQTALAGARLADAYPDMHHASANLMAVGRV